MKRWFVGFFGVVVTLALVASGCGGSSKSSSSTTTSSTSAGGKGGTLMTVANAAPSGSPDPQVNYTLQEWQLLIIIARRPRRLQATGGKPGHQERARPRAESIPKPTNGGKTWTFTLRQGIKFSDGSTLDGADVKSTFERLFKIGNSPNAGTWYNVIQGADACIKTPKTCDLSKGIVVNGDKVTFHLTTADPEFLDKLAVPFAFILPSSTPATNVNIPPPGTGAYKWAQYSPNKQIKLVRNTFFKEWSKDAQPDGNPDVIVQKFGLTPRVAGDGRSRTTQADWMFDQPPVGSPQRAEHEVRRPCARQPADGDLVLRVQHAIPPFNNLKARQGVNYATDRNALVKIYGGPKLAVRDLPDPAAQLPRLQAVLPLHLGQRGRGKWTGPDMAKAKQLIDASGTKGAAVKVNTTTNDGRHATSVSTSSGC